MIMSSSVDPLKLLNRGPAYLRHALQTTQTGNKASLSAAERLNVRKKSTELKSSNGNNENGVANKKERPQTAPTVTKKESIKRSEFETWTAEQLVNRGAEKSGQPGYAARLLARPQSAATPYALNNVQRGRRQPVRGNHNLKTTRERSSSVDRFFDTLGGTMVAVSNPPSLVPSGSISDLSGLSRAASQNYQSRSSSCSLTPPSPDEQNETDIIAKSKPEVSQVEKRIRVMMWLSSCKPTQAQFSTPVKG